MEQKLEAGDEVEVVTPGEREDLEEVIEIPREDSTQTTEKGAQIQVIKEKLIEKGAQMKVIHEKLILIKEMMI